MAAGNGAPLGIFAGGGSVPLRVAEAASRAGRDVFVINVNGEADPAVDAYPHELLHWGEIGRMKTLLKSRGIEEIVLIGNIRVRPDFKTFKLDLGAIKVVPKVVGLMARGDNDLLSGVISIFGDLGFRVVGAHEIAPNLVADNGPLGRHAPEPAAQQDIAKAMDAARAIGVIDAGQAAVSINDRLVALEAAEGTDAMLERVAALRDAKRIKWNGRAGVLAKRPRPQQDLRVDMPTIGIQTVRAAGEIGLAGIAVETGRVMIVDREAAIDLADKTGIFIIGVEGASGNGDA